MDADGMLANWDSAPVDLIGSLSGSDVRSQAMISAAMDKADITTQEAPGRTHEVTDWIGHVVDLTNPETGEIHRGIRIVLFTTDGMTISTCSMPCIKMLNKLTRWWGKGPFDPPKVVEFRKYPSRKIGHYYTIRQIDPASAAAAVGKVQQKPKR